MASRHRLSSTLSFHTLLHCPHKTALGEFETYLRYEGKRFENQVLQDQAYVQPDYPEGVLKAGAKATRKLMAAGVPLIYQGVLMTARCVGLPFNRLEGLQRNLGVPLPASRQWDIVRAMSPEARLSFHQAESGPVMEKLQMWCTRQFEEKRVEPNSARGETISYLLKHWEKLTLFLRQPGTPLDNNICERALKMTIRHRKNALFYRSLNGARVGDIACHRRAEGMACDLRRGLAFDPYGPISRESLNILRAVNRARAAAGLEKIPHSWLRFRRRIVQPFGGDGRAR